jgi:NTP pyrophosphatase (non-canonical NTP hydrolase)
MEFTTYRNRAMSTAFYPGRDSALGALYCGLKLAGEAAESLEAFRKMDKQEITAREFVLELGDVCWYVAALSTELSLDIEYGIYGDPCPNCCMDRLIKSAGNVAETLGKAVRDDGFAQSSIMTAEKRRKIADGLASILGVIAAYAVMLEGDIGEIFELNLDKLAKRAEKGTLGGSGSDR